MVAGRSGVVRRHPQLSRPRHHVLLLLPCRTRSTHAEVLVVEEIPHNLPNDSGTFGDPHLLAMLILKLQIISTVI